MLEPARFCNVAHTWLLERVQDDDERARLHTAWTGPLTTLGDPAPDPRVPHWWHGAEDAARTNAAAAAALARTRRG